MNFIWAGIDDKKGASSISALVKSEAFNWLGTYYYMTKEKPRSEGLPVKLMLDSGAFSAYQKGATIDLAAYMAYIKANQRYIDTYFNLDVIPGVRGKRRTPATIEDGARQSRENLLAMKKAGLTPIPVFHQEENFKWLEYMIQDREPYIALSTFKELTIPENRNWLDQCFGLLTDRDGWPMEIKRGQRLKIHGLGVASFDLLKRYPWATCDATSWALTAAYGAIYVPVYRDGKPNYAEAPIKLTVSEVDRQNGMPKDHYLRYGPAMKQRVEDFLENQVGVKVADAAKDYETRARAIVFFYLKFQDAIGEQPFRYRSRALV